MKLFKVALIKMDSLALYGSRSISFYDLRTGLKNCSQNEFDNCIIDLLKRELIIYTNSSGGPRISLDPRKKEEIDQILR